MSDGFAKPFGNPRELRSRSVEPGLRNAGLVNTSSSASTSTEDSSNSSQPRYFMRTRSVSSQSPVGKTPHARSNGQTPVLYGGQTPSKTPSRSASQTPERGQTPGNSSFQGSRFPTTSNSGPSLPRESRSNYPTRHSVASSNAVRSDDSAESDSNINLNMTDEDVVDCRKKIIEAFSMQNVCYEPFPFGPSLGDSSYSEYVRVDVGNAVKTQISEPGDATKKGLNVLFAERPRKDGFFTKNGIFIKKIGGGSYGTVYKCRFVISTQIGPYKKRSYCRFVLKISNFRIVDKEPRMVLGRDARVHHDYNSRPINVLYARDYVLEPHVLQRIYETAETKKYVSKPIFSCMVRIQNHDNPNLILEANVMCTERASGIDVDNHLAGLLKGMFLVGQTHEKFALSRNSFAKVTTSCLELVLDIYEKTGVVLYDHGGKNFIFDNVSSRSSPKQHLKCIDFGISVIQNFLVGETSDDEMELRPCRYIRKDGKIGYPIQKDQYRRLSNQGWDILYDYFVMLGYYMQGRTHHEHFGEAARHMFKLMIDTFSLPKSPYHKYVRRIVELSHFFLSFWEKGQSVFVCYFEEDGITYINPHGPHEVDEAKKMIDGDAEAMALYEKKGIVRFM